MSQRKIKTKENLEAAQALIDKPQKWAKAWGSGNNSLYGPRLSFYDAIYAAVTLYEHSYKHPTPEFKMLDKALVKKGNYSVDRLLRFEQECSHKELMKLFDKAIEMCDD